MACASADRDASQNVPRTLEDAPRTLQDVPRTLQDVPRTLQDVSRTLRDALGVLTESSEELLEILRLEWMWIPQCGAWAGIEVVVLVVVAGDDGARGSPFYI